MRLRRISQLPLPPRGRKKRGGPIGGYRGKHDRGLFARHEPLVPFGPPRDTIEEWIEQGLHVEIYLKMRGLEKESPPGVWMIRVGNRELSVEEYLLLFDDNEEK